MSILNRKIMKLGNSTFVISLPSKWIKKNQLTKGDDIEMSVSNSSIIVRKPNEHKNSSIYLKMNDKSTKQILGFIEAAYVSGYSEIKIELPKDPDKIIFDFVDILMGFVVISFSHSVLMIKEVSLSKEDDLKILINRTIYLYLDMLEDFMSYLDKGDLESIHNMHIRDKKLNKYLFYCLRIISNSTKLYESEKMINYFFVESINNIFNNIVKLCSELSEDDLKGKEKANLSEAFGVIKDYIRLYIRFFQSFNLVLSPNIVQMKSEINKTGFKSKYSNFFLSVVVDIYSYYLMFLPLLFKLRDHENSSLKNSFSVKIINK